MGINFIKGHCSSLRMSSPYRENCPVNEESPKYVMYEITELEEQAKDGSLIDILGEVYFVEVGSNMVIAELIDSSALSLTVKVEYNWNLYRILKNAEWTRSKVLNGTEIPKLRILGKYKTAEQRRETNKGEIELHAVLNQQGSLLYKN